MSTLSEKGYRKLAATIDDNMICSGKTKFKLIIKDLLLSELLACNESYKFICMGYGGKLLKGFCQNMNAHTLFS